MDEPPQPTSPRGGLLRKPSLLAESIAGGILGSGLKPGDRLPVEAEMVARYGVGRASLREALRILEAQGVIEIRVGAGGGAFVARPQPQGLARPLSILFRMSDVGLREVLEARLIIEPVLAAQAASRPSPDRIEALRRNNELLETCPRGSEEWRRLNREFHTLLSESGHNRPLAMLWQALSTIADGHDAGVRFPPQSMDEAVAAHRKILMAIESHDVNAAHQAMTAHLQATVDHVVRYYPHLLDEPLVVVPERG
ncbi:FadR/GntR family transcriptional regulator [Acrocarpospora catenulata]|uniref:FadR/GntR family transcriptional regulator n=1 Tax=Acrocarpospora catenulata TaxID=2836182 RepID=UPI001BDA4E16|nr:FCD domain-containing protein [Acrocarpospora catenulata]